jgi:hypothetical protein
MPAAAGTAAVDKPEAVAEPVEAEEREGLDMTAADY